MKGNEIVLLDLFSGTGGFAKGFLSAGFTFKKHYFSEIDKHAIANYRYNFKDAEYVGGVEEVTKKKIERPDVVAFGFPCQDLSHSGNREGLDGARSGLFFEALRIVETFQPKIFVFENVQGLLTSNEGKDFEIVLKKIAKLGIYDGQWQLVNSAWFLPQNRERLYFVGHLREEPQPKVFPFEGSADLPEEGIEGKGNQSEDKLLKYEWPDRYRGQAGRIFFPDGAGPTICSSSSTLVYDKESVRRLTPVECERLQGFPDDWTKYGVFEDEVKEISETQRYKMLGNAVSVPVVEKIAKSLLSVSGELEKEVVMDYSESKEVVLYGVDEGEMRIPEIKLKYKTPGKLASRIKSSEDVANFIRSVFESETIELQEKFIVLYLDAANNIKGYYQHTVGGIKGVVADVRIILAAALKSLSVSLIVAHNHPSGNLRPSEGDINVTRKLKEGAAVLDLQLLDHLIITKESYYSFADQGMLGLKGLNHSPTNPPASDDDTPPADEDNSPNVDNKVSDSLADEKKYNSVKKIKKSKKKSAVELSEELKIIKVFLSFHSKEVKVKDVLNLLERLQRAITKKVINKNSKLKKEINTIQTKLVKAANNIHHFRLKENQLIPIEIQDISLLNNLQELVNGGEELGEITEQQIESSPKGVMNSMDFVELQFKTIGFTGKWKDFIGDPPMRFKAMIFGRPKFGKSYLCVDFAGYLAKNHGKTLFVAIEEGLASTLQKKIIEKKVSHPNLEVSDELPKHLSSYRFIFIDSVTKLGLSPEDLTKLEKKNPNTSFLYIFHVRKDGMFRGRNDFQHDVDIVIEVPEKGLAVQYGRFNQGGEMKIFEEDKTEQN